MSLPRDATELEAEAVSSQTAKATLSAPPARERDMWIVTLIVAILSLSVDLPGAAMFWRRFERGRRQSRRAWRKHTCKGEGYV